MLRKRRIYIGLFVLLTGAFLFTFFSISEKTVRKGYTEPLIPASWQKLIYQDLSAETPEISVNGKNVRLESETPFVTSDFDVMLPLSFLRDGLKIMTVVDKDEMILQRKDERIRIRLQSDEVTKGGETAMIAGATREVRGQYYVSADFLSSMFSFDFSFERAENRVAFFLPDSEDFLPAAFSYTENGKLPPVMNQEDDGTCWAYSALSALESTLRPEYKVTFSREHFTSHRIFNEHEKEAGSSNMALAYFLSWMEPVSMNSEKFENPTAGYHVEEARIYDSGDFQAIKEGVFLYGGVTASVYLAMADPDMKVSFDYYYQADTNSYFYNGVRPANHDVLIVGWDDHYSKSNFALGKDIKGDGAFLCLNSWGKSFGNNGLFWVSYFDSRIAGNAMCITKVGKTNNFDKIYQTDLCGATASAGYGSDTAYFANVYTAADHEKLQAIGFYTMGDVNTYEAYLVHDFQSTSDLSGGVRIASGTILKKGFTTVRLPLSQGLSDGERFAVVVRMKAEGTGYPVAVEKKTETAVNVNINDGEGYLSNDGVRFRRTEEESNSNICLKVYTSYQDMSPIDVTEENEK